MAAVTIPLPELAPEPRPECVYEHLAYEYLLKKEFVGTDTDRKIAYEWAWRQISEHDMEPLNFNLPGVCGSRCFPLQGCLSSSVSPVVCVVF